MAIPTMTNGFRVWSWLTAAAATLMGVASGAGIFVPAIYAKETASWAAQGIGQDVVNLGLVVPALVIAVYLGAQGSLRAVLVWIGLLIYVVYSYVLYAFFVHFNALFAVYVAVLGLSFYALVGLLATVDRHALMRLFQGRRGRLQSAYLMFSGIAFGALWLSSIASATIAGVTPPDVIDAGLPVNPIHVLDLAFVLPAMIVTSVLLWKRRVLGYLLAVPLMTFAFTMGVAIIAMMIAMRAKGLPAPAGIVATLTFTTLAALLLTVGFLRPASRRIDVPAAA